MNIVKGGEINHNAVIENWDIYFKDARSSLYLCNDQRSQHKS